MFLHENHDALTATIWSLSSFMDFENRTANFNTPEFIAFLTEAHNLTNPAKDFFGGTMGRTWHSPEDLAADAERYYFRPSMPQSYQFMINFEEELAFSGQVPLSNDRGELLIVPFFSYALNGQSSPEVQALAWDFLKFMHDPSHFEGNPWMYSLVPPYRPLLRSFLEWDLPSRLEHWEEVYGWRPVGGTEQAIAGVIESFERILNMPMAEFQYGTNAINDILVEVLTQFNDGLLNAEQAAAEIQNRVTLVLLELG
jgi:ABC-type glycerol-3-phosphate transport system substrate-binding protein